MTIWPLLAPIRQLFSAPPAAIPRQLPPPAAWTDPAWKPVLIHTRTVGGSLVVREVRDGTTDIEWDADAELAPLERWEEETTTAGITTRRPAIAAGHELEPIGGSYAGADEDTEPYGNLADCSALDGVVVDGP